MVSLGEEELQRLFVCAGFLVKKLSIDTEAVPDLRDKVEFEYLRIIEGKGTHAIKLEAEELFSGVANAGVPKENEDDLLSVLANHLNEAFGTDRQDADRIIRTCTDKICEARASCARRAPTAWATSRRSSGGIFHKVQIELTCNSNHIEWSRLTNEQTLLILETNTIGVADDGARVDDVVEAANHFHCVDLVIEHDRRRPTEALVKQLHLTLKNGTADSRRRRFAVGEYKCVPNEVGGQATAGAKEVPGRMCDLLTRYNALERPLFDDLLDFHVGFELIRLFQNGNGRVGRLLLFKECLRWGIAPFVIDDNLKASYYRGLLEWDRERGYLRDTCLTAQDSFKAWLDYFRIPHKDR